MSSWVKWGMAVCGLLGAVLSACGQTSTASDEVNADKAVSGSSLSAPTTVTQDDVWRALGNISLAETSFYVQAVDDLTPIISINASRAQNPASVIKLVTTYAALKKWGADYRWRTALQSQSEIDHEGRLNTPLLLQGSGDPQLVVERADDLVQQLKKVGLKQLNAPLWIDRSAFTVDDQDPSRYDGEPSMPYNALPDAALINFHALSFRFDPETRQVRMVPWLVGFNLNNSVQFVEGECPVNGWKSTLNLGVSGYSASVGGVYYSGCGEQQWHIHAYQTGANDYLKGVFGALFKGQIGIGASACEVGKFWDKVFARWYDCTAPTIDWTRPEVQSVARVDTDGKGWRTLAQVESPPLSMMIKDMNFFSNNVMARQIFLNLSKQPDRAADLHHSAAEVHRLLQADGLGDSTVVMGNGSGLSNATRISARELAQLLIRANNLPAFIDSLPRIGIEGTVKKRLTDTDMVGRGRMKTGTLSNVRAIAGYIDGKSGKHYVVVSIINSDNAQTAAGKRTHDLLMQWVGEQ